MEPQASEWKDFKQNWMAIIILMISFMPMVLGGYSVYALILMLPLMWTRGFLKFTENSVLCLIFGIIFGFTYRMHEDIPASIMVMYCLFPFVSYQSGQYIYKRFQNVNSFSLLLVILAVCMGAWTIVLCIRDYIDTGNIVNVTRSIGIDEDVWEKDAEAEGLGATNMGLLVSVLLGTVGVLLLRPRSFSDRLVRIITIVGAILGLYVTIHLLNRTGLIIIAISLFIAFLRPPVSPMKIGVAISVLLIIAASVFAIAQSSEVIQKALEGYAERNSVTGYGIESAGGRTDRWAAAFEQIPTIPFGASRLDFQNMNTYAHNLWLDCAIVGGWIPFVLLIVMTVRLARSMIKVMRMEAVSSFNRSYFLLYAVTMTMQSMVEPILQCSLPYFCLLLFFWGIINDLSYSNLTCDYGEEE